MTHIDQNWTVIVKMTNLSNNFKTTLFTFFIVQLSQRCLFPETDSWLTLTTQTQLFNEPEVGDLVLFCVERHVMKSHTDLLVCSDMW